MDEGEVALHGHVELKVGRVCSESAKSEHVVETSIHAPDLSKRTDVRCR